MFRRLISVISFLAVATTLSQAYASHYLLDDVSFFSAAERERFGKQGIEDTEQFLKKASTPKARLALKAATGLEADRIEALAKLCDLLQVKGLGPKMALLFTATGLQHTDALSKADLNDLYPKMKEINNKRHISEVLPRREMVGNWIKAAKTVPVRLTL